MKVCFVVGLGLVKVCFVVGFVFGFFVLFCVIDEFWWAMCV